MSEQRDDAWWRGGRGEWYVIAQVALIALVFLGPQTVTGWPAWPAAVAAPARVIGIVLMAAGLALLAAGGLKLGAEDLTPLPYPRAGGVLRQSGAYGVVRHPMYGGGVIIAYGWALVVHGWLTLLYATVLLVFADIKASREEAWLVTAYADYPEYRRRVRKLIPFIH